VATSGKLYGVPTVPAGADVVETERSGGFTTRLGFIVTVIAVGVVLSVAFTVIG
jgi:hypothetical protein